MTKPRWDIRSEGRSWRGEEAWKRFQLRPEKIEMIDGKILWSDEERELLENLGADHAVQLGDPEVGRAAVAKLLR